MKTLRRQWYSISPVEQNVTIHSRKLRHRLERNVRSKRFAIFRDLPNVTPFRVATSGRKTAPFSKMANSTPIRNFSKATFHRRKGATAKVKRPKIWTCALKARSSPEWSLASDQSLLGLQGKSLDPEQISRNGTRPEAAYRPAACAAVTPDTEQRPTSRQVKDYRRTCKTNNEWMFTTCTTHTTFLEASPVVQVQRDSSIVFFQRCTLPVASLTRSASARPCFNFCGLPQEDAVCRQVQKSIPT